MLNRQEAIEYMDKIVEGDRASPMLKECCRLAIDALWEQEENQWCTVAEGPPDKKFGKIMVTDGVDLSVVHAECLYTAPDGSIRVAANFKVTHWKPAPKLPENIRNNKEERQWKTML